MKRNIEEKVKEIAIDQLGVIPDTVVPTALFIEDLGADSLDGADLIIAFEEEFAVEIPLEKAETFKTVGDVIKFLEEKVSK